jgi:inosine/xanthosine triphosphate pyrophosphatase family protein
MKKLIVGTTNSAKISQVVGALAPLNVAVTGIPNSTSIPDIIEDGQTAPDNARKKALAYAAAIGQPVLAMDNALYLDRLATNLQPGLNVRRIPGHAPRPTDQEVLAYYSGLIASLGGTTGRWEFACCLADAQGIIGETVIVSPRQFVSTPSTQVIPGFPIDSLQIDPDTGVYISEMNATQREVFRRKGFGTKLCEFIEPFLARLEP